MDELEELVTQVRNYRSPKKASENISSETIIGIGAGRLIFEIDNETVLKISPNSMGDEQNRMEAKIWDEIPQAGEKHLAPVVESADDDSWIKMKRVTNPEETYESFETEKEKRIRDLLASYGITVHEVEVGYYRGELVAYDYGSAEL